MLFKVFIIFVVGVTKRFVKKRVAEKEQADEAMNKSFHAG